jgi:dihydroorotate dehydrogenase
MIYQYLLKPILFRFSAEKAHYITVSLLKFVLAIPGLGWMFRQYYSVNDPKLERKLFGLIFPNPVGLAAGFDKDGKSYDAISALGFGFVEIGTVTPVGQEGNDKPRLFRLPDEQGLINRMGFNNEGVDALVSRLKTRKKSNVIIGGNIGKNKITPNEDASSDYVKCFNALFDYVDYFVVNVSSPNTPGLRELQEKEPLTQLLSELQNINNQKPTRKPILLKIAPDLTHSQLDDIIDIIAVTQLDGLIATNTTIDRTSLTSDTASIGPGGLSGKPLFDKSIEVIKYLHQQSQGRFPIIGVGGITCANDALKILDAGASLVQIYSGLVYAGPRLVKDINKLLLS